MLSLSSLAVAPCGTGESRGRQPRLAALLDVPAMPAASQRLRHVWMDPLHDLNLGPITGYQTIGANSAAMVK